MLNIITIDLEEWYHGNLVQDMFSDQEELEVRVIANTKKLLALFHEANAKATFFVLGCIAERFPELIAEIRSYGHEIATHGYAHELIYKQTKEEFLRDIKNARQIIEGITSEKVKGYRAPSWSVTENSLWALTVLQEEGFLYDSSIFPIRTFLYGIPSAPQFMNYPLKRREEKGLAEVPPSTLSLFGKKFGFSGGFFFRVLPYFIIENGIKRVNKTGNPAVVYLHPREIDPDEPRIRLNLRDALINYYGTKWTERKLRKLLKKYQFTSIEEYYKF